jgi:Acetyltransferases
VGKDIELTLTNAEVGELDQIFNIEKDSFEEPYPIDLLLAYLYVAREFFLVARAEKRVLGYIIGIPRLKYRGHVISIAVKKEARRKGIGSILLKVLEDKFKAFGCTHSYLEVMENNYAAIMLYRNSGYEIIGYYDKYYRNGKGAFIMMKNLIGGSND